MSFILQLISDIFQYLYCKGFFWKLFFKSYKDFLNRFVDFFFRKCNISAE